MFKIILILLELVAPAFDFVEDTLRLGRNKARVGDICVLGNDEILDSAITESILLYSALRIRQWRVTASELLLFGRFYGSNDCFVWPGPQIVFDKTDTSWQFRTITIDFRPCKKRALESSHIRNFNSGQFVNP